MEIDKDNDIYLSVDHLKQFVSKFRNLKFKKKKKKRKIVILLYSLNFFKS